MKKFKTKEEKLAYLIENREELIEMKKSTVKHTDLSNIISSKSSKQIKSENTNSIDRTIIGNTYNWLDSHDDVHVKGCFTKSIKERSDKIFHLHDHEYKITAKVGEPSKIYEKDILWKDLGVDLSGYTTSLMMDTNIRKDYNAMVFEEYKSNKINQHSVGMYYVKVDLAINDDNEKEAYKEWNDNIDKIGNKEKAIEQGYFWVVKEAKLAEISAVLAGSNELTGTLEAEKSLQNEAEKSLQDKLEFYKHLN
jgi:hypothetical protein